jgi:hypothetical protein
MAAAETPDKASRTVFDLMKDNLDPDRAKQAKAVENKRSNSVCPWTW